LSNLHHCGVRGILIGLKATWPTGSNLSILMM
jgi:hypothetical protein